MKKLFILSNFVVITLIGTTLAWALDPVAPREFRNFGMIYVETPTAMDQITLTNLQTGESQPLKREEVKVVPIGEYKVQVQMQEYAYDQKVLVTPTERTDVIVPGYGNLKVNTPQAATVTVFKSGTEQQVSQFPSNEVKTLPRGHYDVKIQMGKFSMSKDKVWVVTNTTRELDVSILSMAPPEK